MPIGIKRSVTIDKMTEATGAHSSRWVILRVTLRYAKPSPTDAKTPTKLANITIRETTKTLQSSLKYSNTLKTR
ncbi:hypothetical protein KAH81_07835 [bacterium]|nr:hypothetical protein [bacterium]